MSNPKRVLAGRIGGYTTRSRNDPLVYTKPGRDAARTKLDERLLAEIDERAPDITDIERSTRLEAARRAHFGQLSRKAQVTRRRKQRARQRRVEANAASWAELNK